MPFGAAKLNGISRYVAPTGVTRSWAYYNGSDDGSEVLVHNDTSTGDGVSIHRIASFDSSSGIVSYGIQNDNTKAYWNYFSVDGTTITVGSQNSYTSGLNSSHVTSQHAVRVTDNKVIFGHMQFDSVDSKHKLAYVVFTKSGNSATVSDQKYLEMNQTFNVQHSSIFELDKANGLFVFEMETGVAVLYFNDSNDTFTIKDQKFYSTLGQTWPNVAMAFNKVDNNNWMFAGTGPSGFYITQGYNFNSSTNTITQNAGTNTNIVSTSGLTSTSRAYVNSSLGNNGGFLLDIGDSTNGTMRYYPIKHTTSSVSVGSFYAFNSANSTSYGRTEHGIWIDGSTFVSIMGYGPNNQTTDDKLIVYPISYNYTNNTVTNFSTASEVVIASQTYYFQGPKAAILDTNRIVIVYPKPGFDSTGDLMLKVIQAPIV